MGDKVPCCRGNFVKSVEILAFLGSSEPTEWTDVGMKVGEVSLCFPCLSMLRKEERSRGVRNKVHANVPCVCR